MAEKRKAEDELVPNLNAKKVKVDGEDGEEEEEDVTTNTNDNDNSNDVEMKDTGTTKEVSNDQSTTEESKTIPVILGGQTFASGDDLSKYCKDILKPAVIDSKLAGEQYSVLFELLSKGHHAPQEKIGVGVSTIKIINHPEYPSTRCFCVVRSDETTADFSYRKCIQKLFPGWTPKFREPGAAKGKGMRGKIKTKTKRNQKTKKKAK